MKLTIDQYVAETVALLTPETFPNTALNYADMFQGTDDEWMCLPRPQEMWELDYARELATLYHAEATPREAAGALLRCEGDLYLGGTPAERALRALTDERDAQAR